MIESKDLRIGNYVNHSVMGIVRVCKISRTTFKVSHDYDNISVSFDEEDCQPIKLTPEILLKCGFTEGINKWYNLPYFTDNKESAEMFVITYNIVSNRLGVYEVDLEDTVVFCAKKFNYLHELQNWYKFQVGEELNVNL